jgi:precorrin-2 dehydrogenase/sirohydrochlorin ferrochelatase
VPEREHYVACLDLEGRRCLVVGDDVIAHEKAEALQRAGAEVTQVRPGVYTDGHLDDAWLVVAATADDELNRRVSADAETRRVFCNVADVPELCSFILPAIHRRGPIALAVSTGGASPALAQRLRDDLGRQIGPEHEELAGALRRLRPWTRRTFETYEERSDFFRRAVTRALG